MKLEKIFEDDNIIVYQDNKGYDFAFDIENKNNDEIVIRFGDYDEEVKVNEWVGLFADEEYIIESILKGNYEVL